ncbi:MAG: type IX secretion system membrane protein PorP/SprF [Bacteroidota bacterium]
MKRYFLTSVLILLSAGFVKSQDVMLNTPANVPIWINPAAAGNSGYEFSFAAGYKLLWPKIGSYGTSFFSGEYALERKAFSIQFLNDVAGTKPTVRNRISTGFSYILPLTKLLSLSGGAQFNLESRNSRKLALIDDFLDDNLIDPTEEINDLNTNILSSSIGFMLLHSYFNIGFSIDDVVQTTISPDIENLLLDKNERFTVHAGARTPPSRAKFALEFDAVWTWQGPASQAENTLSIAYFANRETILGMGVGYRNFFFQNEDFESTQDGLVFNFSYTGLDPVKKRRAFSVVLSYNLITSRLAQSGGGGQVTLLYNFSNTKDTGTWQTTTKKVRKKVLKPLECIMEPESYDFPQRMRKKKKKKKGTGTGTTTNNTRKGTG